MQNSIEIPEVEMKLFDKALAELSPAELTEYEEIIELWITYGGD